MNYKHGGNSHDRRKAERKERFLMAYDYRPSEPLAVWSPIGLAIGAPRLPMGVRAGKPGQHSAALDDAPKSQPVGFLFFTGASVRNKRTKSVATMLERGGNQILVKRRDNRSVYWPLEECENWNV